MTTIITVTGRTPGIGKTSVAVNLAATLAEHYQERVLLVDLGQNETLLEQFGYARTDFPYSLEELIQRNAQDFDTHILRPTERLHLLSGREPSSRDVLDSVRSLVSLIFLLEREHGWTGDDRLAHFLPDEKITRDWLRNLLQSLANEYDFILFDGARNTEILTWCACSLSQIILIPDGLNLSEIQEMKLTIDVIAMLALVYQLEPPRQQQRILRHKTVLSTKYEDTLYAETARGLFLTTQIRASPLLSNQRKEPLKFPVLESPTSSLAKDYKALVKQLEQLIARSNNSVGATSC
ncbi:MAG: ParA family protein [Acidobacteria bacterium]|nr:ParA family protein [Acidobacteriota bacterium]